MIARLALPAALTLIPDFPYPDSLPPLPSFSLLVGQDGWTPLFFACQWGRLDIIKALIGKGANILAKSKVRTADARSRCRGQPKGVLTKSSKMQPSLFAAGGAGGNDADGCCCGRREV